MDNIQVRGHEGVRIAGMCFYNIPSGKEFRGDESEFITATAEEFLAGSRFSRLTEDERKELLQFLSPGGFVLTDASGRDFVITPRGIEACPESFKAGDENGNYTFRFYKLL